jgi:hypothetical protein
MESWLSRLFAIEADTITLEHGDVGVTAKAP